MRSQPSKGREAKIDIRSETPFSNVTLHAEQLESWLLSSQSSVRRTIVEHSAGLLFERRDTVAALSTRSGWSKIQRWQSIAERFARYPEVRRLVVTRPARFLEALGFWNEVQRQSLNFTMESSKRHKISDHVMFPTPQSNSKDSGIGFRTDTFIRVRVADIARPDEICEP